MSVEFPAVIDRRYKNREPSTAHCNLWSEEIPVSFLKRGGFSGDLRRVELDLLGIFFGLDFDEAFGWLLHSFGQIVQ